MSAYPARSPGSALASLPARLLAAIPRLQIGKGALFGLIMLGALLSFEVFNYGTTEYALTDLLGGLNFAGVRWATILALAFCGIDFAGIARLLTPERGEQEPVEIWYLLAAWFLAATMNAMLTWWAVSLALIGHQGLGNEILGRETLLSSVPIFVAVLVWLIRVLMIGTFTLAGERLFSQADRRAVVRQRRAASNRRPAAPPVPQPVHAAASSGRRPVRAAPKPVARPEARFEGSRGR